MKVVATPRMGAERCPVLFWENQLPCNRAAAPSRQALNCLNAPTYRVAWPSLDLFLIRLHENRGKPYWLALVSTKGMVFLKGRAMSNVFLMEVTGPFIGGRRSLSPPQRPKEMPVAPASPHSY